MATMNLSETETLNYRGAVRADLRFRTAELAYARGKRFWQIVGSNGAILDIGEVDNRSK